MAIDRSGGSIIRKVLLACALGIGSIVIALSVSYLGLNQMLTVVYDLGTPNEKLKTLNNLYRKATALNDQQRIDAIRNPGKPHHDFLEDSNELLVILDSLMAMQWSDTMQTYRLREMQGILTQRNKLFLAYLRIRANVINDRVMAGKFDTLTEMLSTGQVAIDSSVRTSLKKSTTITYLGDTIVPESQKRSIFSRLFRKKNPPPEKVPKTEMKEEVEVTVDTISIGLRNPKLAEAARLIDELGTSEISKRKRLADRELALLATTRELFRQMVDILHVVEAEELEHVRKNNEAAITVVDESSDVIVVILLAFSLTAAGLVYLIIMDVTRSNYLKASLVREKERAEELSLVKERFLSNMSHEIRTPLQAIIGYAEHLRSMPATSGHEAVRAISSSSDHLLHIVNEVLDYSRLESGRIEFDKTDFYLLETVEEVVASMRAEAERKGLSLRFDASAASNEMVVGDAFRLRQVLYNLLGNAIKFTHEGHATLSVAAHVEGSQVKTRIEVSDTGIGIKENDIERIFHRFEQADGSITNKYGGTGLGLTIVKMIVDAQRGTLKVTSAEGRGSTFSVELAYDRSMKSAAVSPAPANTHVLVLDDDKLIVDLCSLMLKKAAIPFGVHSAPEQLFHTDIDPNVTHILMDVRLGHVNGIELCRSIKQRSPKVKIIAMTAGANTKAASEALADFDGVLWKPFRVEDLYELLGAAHVGEPSNSDQFSLIRTMTNHDEELFQSVLADFVGETKRDIQLVEKAINEQHNEAMLLAVHKLSGRTHQFGFGTISAALRQIERELEAGEAAIKLKKRWSALRENILAALTVI